MSRLFIIAALLGVTIGLPYVLDRLSSGGSPGGAAPPPQATAPTSPAAMYAPAAGELSGPLPSLGSLVHSNTALLDGTRFHSVQQVLRFDITKEWVYQNWSRKSTGPT